MKLKYTFYALTIIHSLQKAGIDIMRLYEFPGIKFNRESPIDSEISFKYLHHLTQLYKNHFKTDNCGLEIIQKVDFQNTDFIGPYAFSCPTLLDAMNKIYEVYMRLNPLITYEMYPPEKPTQFIYHIDKLWEAKYAECAQDFLEFIMANGLLSSRGITKQNIIPVELRFKQKKPKDLTLYKDIFNCPVYFEQEQNKIVYQSDIMDYKIPSYNPTLMNILHDFAKKVIQENEKSVDIVSKVKAIIMKGENFQSPKEDDVANELNMSKRTLQNNLQKKNISFKKILDGIQSELAQEYLKSDSISNKEISWMLGYNDVSNFYRAFKRWTGKTPNEFKLELE